MMIPSLTLYFGIEAHIVLCCWWWNLFHLKAHLCKDNDFSVCLDANGEIASTLGGIWVGNLWVIWSTTQIINSNCLSFILPLCFSYLFCFNTTQRYQPLDACKTLSLNTMCKTTVLNPINSSGFERWVVVSWGLLRLSIYRCDGKGRRRWAVYTHEDEHIVYCYTLSLFLPNTVHSNDDQSKCVEA